MHVLALNGGSSSLKFGLYEVARGTCTMRLDGEVEHDGHGRSTITARAGTRTSMDGVAIDARPSRSVDHIASLVADEGLPPPDAIGHRIVHGGVAVQGHRVIDDAVLKDLEAARAFAPLHLPPALDLIRLATKRFPALPQVACLDTAFHARMDDVARVLPLPRAFEADGIRRFGFHGLSCESIVRQFGRALPQRLVIAHLGNGASVTAVLDGRSIDTSMGLTPTGGLMMGTRSGDLDPGVLVYLVRERKLDADALEALVNHRSGLAGISGIGSDMRALHAASDDPDATLAIAMFCHAVRKHIAGMVAALQGVDTIVFTGGIGENDAATRATIHEGLAWLGDDVAMQVLPSREDEQIASITAAVLAA